MPNNNITHIYDKLFKRLFISSNKAIINLVNGLFDKNFPIDSSVHAESTEKSSTQLRTTYADVIIKIAGNVFHLEIQSEKDDHMVLRVFDYGYQYSLANKIIDGNTIELHFPLPIVIYITSDSATPNKAYLKFFVGDSKKPIEYDVPSFKLFDTDLKTIEDKKMALLLPFYILKFRGVKKSSLTKKDAISYKKLLRKLYLIGKNSLDNGDIEDSDFKTLLSMSKILNEHLYSKVKVFKEEGVDDMLNGAWELEYDIILREKEQEREKERAEERKITEEAERRAIEAEKKAASTILYLEKYKEEVEKSKAKEIAEERKAKEEERKAKEEERKAKEEERKAKEEERKARELAEKKAESTIFDFERYKKDREESEERKVKEMLAANIPLEVILKCTDFTIEEIKEFQKYYKK